MFLFNIFFYLNTKFDSNFFDWLYVSSFFLNDVFKLWSKIWNSNDDGNIGTSIRETTIRSNKFCPIKINFDIESTLNGMERCIFRFVSFQDHSHDYGNDKHIFNILCANLNSI